MREAILLRVRCDRTVEGAPKQSPIASQLKTRSLPRNVPAIGFIILDRLSLTESQHTNAQGGLRTPITPGKKNYGARFAPGANGGKNIRAFFAEFAEDLDATLWSP